MTREELNKEIHKELFKEEKQEKIKGLIKIIIKTILFLIIFFTVFFLYTTYISTVKISVREYRIKNNNIPNSLNGLKIIQFSDLHYGTTMFLKNVKEVKKIINKRKPDIVVFTGDLIDKNYKLSSKEQEKLINELNEIEVNLGKYAILGDEDNEKISTIFNQSNFIVLRNEYDLIYKDDNNPILLVGISSKEKDFEKAYSYFKEENHKSDIYTITLIHEPDTVEDISGTYNSNLYLAGHSHNGEIRIPFIKYPIIQFKGSKKYNQDYYKINNSKLYITSGLGSKSGIRLFCRPSINFYRLSNN
ncbi:MAG: metallophosphoesterase [Bacilli bacterium]|nr:metallophosphoesterase [Bacilli bacterium]